MEEIKYVLQNLKILFAYTMFDIDMLSGSFQQPTAPPPETTKFFWKISENLKKRLEYKPETFKFNSFLV